MLAHLQSRVSSPKKGTDKFFQCMVILADLHDNVNGWAVLSSLIFIARAVTDIAAARPDANSGKLSNYMDNSQARAINQRLGQPVGRVGERMRKIVGATALRLSE